MPWYDPRTWFRAKAIEFGNPGWPGTDMLPPLDLLAYRRRLTPAELVNLFRDTAYYCANLNARGVARTKLCAYVRTGAGQPKSRLPGRKVSRHMKARFKSIGYVTEDQTIEEVEQHPFIDLLNAPFKDQTGYAPMGRFTLLEITQLYLEILGRAYWRFEYDNAGLPITLFPLMSQFVEPWRAADSKNMVDEYRYHDQRKQISIPPEQVLPFLCPSLNDPYTSGTSPMSAAAERFGVSMSYLHQTQAMLNNRARPDAMISPKAAGDVMSDPTAVRLRKWFKQRFSRGNVGNVFVATDPVEFVPIQYSLKDQGELRDEEGAQKQVCRCFDVPISMLDKDANRASAEEGRKQHATDALLPRLTRIEHAINAGPAKRYDPSGRLFFAFDEPYHESISPTASDLVALVQGARPILTDDEAREILGYGPMPEEYRQLLEERRKEEMAAASQQLRPTDRMNPKQFREYFEARKAIREGRSISHVRNCC